jgi:hypothetical protein
VRLTLGCSAPPRPSSSTDAALLAGFSRYQDDTAGASRHSQADLPREWPFRLSKAPQSSRAGPCDLDRFSGERL